MKYDEISQVSYTYIYMYIYEKWYRLSIQKIYKPKNFHKCFQFLLYSTNSKREVSGWRLLTNMFVPMLSNISYFSPCDNRESPTSKWAVRNTQDFLRCLVTTRRDRWRLCSSDDQVCVCARDARTQWRATTRLSAKLRVVNAVLCGNDVVKETRVCIIYPASKFIDY